MLTPELVAFLEGGRCTHLGTRNDQLEPAGIMVAAASVDADRTHLTVFIPRSGSGAVLANLRANHQAALCFCRPVDDKTCQVKGVLVDVRPATAKDRATVDAQVDLCDQELEQIGVPRQLRSGYAWWPCVSVRVRVTEVFDQTPGPGAGAPLP